MTTLFGDITKVGTGFTLEFDRVLDTDVDTLWSAITEPESLRRWMAVYTGTLALHGTWQALGDDGAVWCTGTVSECAPPHRFVTSWHAVEEEPTVLRIEVSTASDGARLRLTHEGVQSIFYGAGWQSYLEQLDELLGAAPSSLVDPSRAPGISWDDHFAALRGPWEQRFGALRG